MKQLNCMVLLFVFIFSNIAAVNFPKYRMVDMDLFETDRSYSYGINDNGQVIGTYEAGETTNFFIYDEQQGLRTIDLPQNAQCLKLNNNGQIAGIINETGTYTAFIWDYNLGLWEPESSKNQISISGLNDKGQVLGSIKNQIFIWDHGKKTNLTELFFEQVPGDWNSFQPVTLNNHGHVAFNVYESKKGQFEPGFRSFLWKNGSFQTTVSKEEWETKIPEAYVKNSVNIKDLDDDGNMILTLYKPIQGCYSCSEYFVCPSQKMFIFCKGCDLIRNGLPIGIGCLPSELKKDPQGNLYFFKGIEVRKLLNSKESEYKTEYKIFNIFDTEISDQNSSGYFTGGVHTLFGHHAFLAIPEFNVSKI